MRQIKNIKKDMVFGEGGSNQIPLPTGQGTQEVFCIRNDFIPLWLAKISITQKTREERPEFSKKLLEYQLKAKDILAAAFMPKQNMPQTTDGKIALLAQGHTELKAEVDEIKAEVKALKDDMPVFLKDTKDIQSAIRKKAIEVLGGKDSNAYHDRSIRAYTFADIQIELRRQFGVKRYDQIRHKDVPDALKIIEEYKPPLHIRDKIAMANAQQTLDLEGGVHHG